MIPKVRQWTVRTVDGARHSVLAPTRFLAMLVFHDEHPRAGVIRSITPTRLAPARETARSSSNVESA